MKAVEQFALPQAFLTRTEHTAAEIDRVLIDCIESVSRFVYITAPSTIGLHHAIVEQARPVYLTLLV